MKLEGKVSPTPELSDDVLELAYCTRQLMLAGGDTIDAGHESATLAPPAERTAVVAVTVPTPVRFVETVVDIVVPSPGPGASTIAEN
jgi:hypothetical protein